MTPDEIAWRLKYGQDTLAAGRQQAANPSHWTQALAGALQMGLGGHYGANAAYQEKEGKASANRMLADALMGGFAPKDVAARMMGNPWSADQGQRLAMQELDPMTGLNREKVQLGIERLKADAALDPLRRQDIETGLMVKRAQAAKLAREAAQPLSQIGDSKDVFDVEQKLRKEFSGLAKPYFEVRDAYNRVEASTKEPSAAGDLALVFNFMKMLDPGSVVREGEFATAQNAAGIPDRIRAWYNNVVNGQRLTDNTRSDFLNQARNLYRSQAQQFQRIQDQYKTMSGRYGLNPQNTMIDFSRPADAAALEDARKAIAAGAPRNAVLERLRQNGIDPGGL